MIEWNLSLDHFHKLILVGTLLFLLGPNEINVIFRDQEFALGGLHLSIVLGT